MSILVLRFNPKKNTSTSDGSVIFSTKNCHYDEIPNGQNCIVLWSNTHEEQYKTGVIKRISKVDYNQEFDNRLSSVEKTRFKNKTVWKFQIKFEQLDGLQITPEMKKVQFPRLIHTQ